MPIVTATTLLVGLSIIAFDVVVDKVFERKTHVKIDPSKKGGDVPYTKDTMLVVNKLEGEDAAEVWFEIRGARPTDIKQINLREYPDIQIELKEKTAKNTYVTTVSWKMPLRRLPSGKLEQMSDRSNWVFAQVGDAQYWIQATPQGASLLTPDYGIHWALAFAEVLSKGK